MLDQRDATEPPRWLNKLTTSGHTALAGRSAPGGARWTDARPAPSAVADSCGTGRVRYVGAGGDAPRTCQQDACRYVRTVRRSRPSSRAIALRERPSLCVHGIEQPLRVARVASRSGTLDGRACPFDWGGLGNGGRQAGTVRGGDFLDPAREPLPQLEPVTDLQRVRRAVRDALPVRQWSVTGHDTDTGCPRSHAASGAASRPSQNGSGRRVAPSTIDVGVQREVVHAQHRGRRDLRQGHAHQGGTARSYATATHPAGRAAGRHPAPPAGCRPARPGAAARECAADSDVSTPPPARRRSPSGRPGSRSTDGARSAGYAPDGRRTRLQQDDVHTDCAPRRWPHRTSDSMPAASHVRASTTTTGPLASKAATVTVVAKYGRTAGSSRPHTVRMHTNAERFARHPR